MTDYLTPSDPILGPARGSGLGPFCRAGQVVPNCAPRKSDRTGDLALDITALNR